GQGQFSFPLISFWFSSFVLSNSGSQLVTTTANKGEDVQRTVSVVRRILIYCRWVGAIHGCSEDLG
ncbi:hypothetical protein, partial [Oceaniglobus ichthyenteri]|uniref:hypothetical protein n=1 Tax=Oceaniglobus ichthyenteri TaxID=2136177 RepID=UPI00197F7BC4